MTWAKVTLCMFMILYPTYAYKILVVSPYPARSHAILGDALVKYLALAGHEVTYITAYPPKTPIHQAHIIDVSENQLLFNKDKMLDLKSKLEKSMSFSQILSVMSLVISIPKKTLEHANVVKLMNDERQHFDVVISEWMFLDTYAGFAALYNCPHIWFSSVEPHWNILRLIDENTNPAYTTDIRSSSIPPFTFKERIVELLYQVIGSLIYAFYLFATDADNFETSFAPIIRNKGLPVPNFDEVRYNASLVLGNSHVSLGVSTRVPESYKHIGGFHIDKDIKPLPKDLQKLMDNAKHGVIYFSMGSNLKSDSLPNEIKQNLLKMFGELKQIVLWKFEEELANRPANVHMLKWAPQQSLLAHPNCILFITHGGLLSTTETVHYGVPIIGIPVFADQFVNVGRAVEKGFAKRVDLSYTMANDLKKAINEITSDVSFSNKVKELSFIYHNRPVPPGKELVHWVEHVIKSKGARHLRSPALMMPWYQKYYVDLIALLILIILAAKFTLELIFLNTREDVKKKMR